MTRGLTIAAVAIGAAMGGAYGAGVRWNITPSMPMGLWRVQAIQGPVHRGDAVTLCLEPAPAAFGRARGYLTGGECPGDVELLIKTIAAVPGDSVDVSSRGAAVNGRPVPHSAPLPRDDAGRPVAAVAGGLYRVGPTEVWVIATADDRSFDSRYFGPVPVANLRGQATPLFVSHE
jgi:conjugative transfer signal peptidase TraF